MVFEKCLSQRRFEASMYRNVSSSRQSYSTEYGWTWLELGPRGRLKDSAGTTERRRTHNVLRTIRWNITNRDYLGRDDKQTNERTTEHQTIVRLDPCGSGPSCDTNNSLPACLSAGPYVCLCLCSGAARKRQRIVKMYLRSINMILGRGASISLMRGVCERGMTQDVSVKF